MDDIQLTWHGGMIHQPPAAAASSTEEHAFTRNGAGRRRMLPSSSHAKEEQQLWAILEQIEAALFNEQVTTKATTNRQTNQTQSKNNNCNNHNININNSMDNNNKNNINGNSRHNNNNIQHASKPQTHSQGCDTTKDTSMATCRRRASHLLQKKRANRYHSGTQHSLRDECNRWEQLFPYLRIKGVAASHQPQQQQPTATEAKSGAKHHRQQQSKDSSDGQRLHLKGPPCSSETSASTTCSTPTTDADSLAITTTDHTPTPCRWRTPSRGSQGSSQPRSRSASQLAQRHAGYSAVTSPLTLSEHATQLRLCGRNQQSPTKYTDRAAAAAAETEDMVAERRLSLPYLCTDPDALCIVGSGTNIHHAIHKQQQSSGGGACHQRLEEEEEVLYSHGTVEEVFAWDQQRSGCNNACFRQSDVYRFAVCEANHCCSREHPPNRVEKHHCKGCILANSARERQAWAAVEPNPIQCEHLELMFDEAWKDMIMALWPLVEACLLVISESDLYKADLTATQHQPQEQVRSGKKSDSRTSQGGSDHGVRGLCDFRPNGRKDSSSSLIFYNFASSSREEGENDCTLNSSKSSRSCSTTTSPSRLNVSLARISSGRSSDAGTPVHIRASSSQQSKRGQGVHSPAFERQQRRNSFNSSFLDAARRLHEQCVMKTNDEEKTLSTGPLLNTAERSVVKGASPVAQSAYGRKRKSGLPTVSFATHDTLDMVRHGLSVAVPPFSSTKSTVRAPPPAAATDGAAMITSCYAAPGQHQGRGASRRAVGKVNLRERRGGREVDSKLGHRTMRHFPARPHLSTSTMDEKQQSSAVLLRTANLASLAAAVYGGPLPVASSSTAGNGRQVEQQQQSSVRWMRAARTSPNGTRHSRALTGGSLEDAVWGHQYAKNSGNSANSVYRHVSSQDRPVGGRSAKARGHLRFYNAGRIDRNRSGESGGGDRFLWGQSSPFSSASWGLSAHAAGQQQQQQLKLGPQTSDSHHRGNASILGSRSSGMYGKQREPTMTAGPHRRRRPQCQRTRNGARVRGSVDTSSSNVRGRHINSRQPQRRPRTSTNAAGLSIAYGRSHVIS